MVATQILSQKIGAKEHQATSEASLSIERYLETKSREFKTVELRCQARRSS